MKSLLLILPVLFALSACESDDQPRPELSDDYLPLAIGNYWEFETTGIAEVKEELRERRTVEDLVTLNDNQYYVVVSEYLLEALSVYRYDTAYYRVDNKGFVFVYRKSTGIEENRYRLNAKDGDTWSYPFGNNSTATMRVSESEKKIGKVEVRDCKDYSFDVPNWADEEYTYSLAPGVGFVREFADSWGSGQVLKRARINGLVLEF